MRIAILGAGIGGVCTALELASKGYSVDLYDENIEPISKASFHNEGKIHLGFIYAKDKSLRTAKLMITGALHFSNYLSRWIDFVIEDLSISTPFFYGVHKETMESIDGLQKHYFQCKKIFDEMSEATGLSYLEQGCGCQYEILSEHELERLVSVEYFLAMFRTTELAVDPRAVANLLRVAVHNNPRINFICSARITDACFTDDGKLAISFRKGGDNYTEDYDSVTNILWHGRLEIDNKIGLAPDQKWMHRYKFCNRVFVPLQDTNIPSITGVLGPFGDIVNFGKRGLFLSWYPRGMIGMSFDLRPPDWNQMLSEAERYGVFKESFDEWLKLCPMLGDLQISKGDVDPGGGVIFAWGETDVDDQKSKLHDRHEIGLRSLKNYHSVDTGKYTTAPYLAVQTADRILGVS